MTQISNIEKICISCPIGCHLTIEQISDAPHSYKITGNQCKRGVTYAENEMRHPMRMATTTVRIIGGRVDRLPVKTSKAIPKNLVKSLCDFVEHVDVNAPIALGDVVIKNIFNTGADVIACRTIEVESCSKK